LKTTMSPMFDRAKIDTQLVHDDVVTLPHVGFIELDGTKYVWNTNVRMRNDAATATTRTINHSMMPRPMRSLRYVGYLRGSSSVSALIP